MPNPPAAPAIDVPDDPYASRVGLDDRPQDHARTPIADALPAGDPDWSLPAEAPPTDPRRLVATSPMPMNRTAAGAGRESAPPETVSTPEPAGRRDELDEIDALIDRGISHLSGIRNYRVVLDRQERVRETLQPAEQVILSVRVAPFAVRLEWPEGPNRGREVLFSEAECGGLMHVKLGKTLIPVPPMQLVPDSPLALGNSRHPITEAGLLDILAKTKAQLELARLGDEDIGRFERFGPLEPPEIAAPCHEILRETPVGERWRLLLDESSCLPVLVEATRGDGQLLERYLFRDLQIDVADLDDPGAFDPTVRFGRTSAPRLGSPVGVPTSE